MNIYLSTAINIFSRMCFNFTFVHRAMVAWCREARRFDCAKRRGTGRGPVTFADFVGVAAP
jgi:hypothetical protein